MVLNSQSKGNRQFLGLERALLHPSWGTPAGRVPLPLYRLWKSIDSQLHVFQRLIAARQSLVPFLRLAIREEFCIRGEPTHGFFNLLKTDPEEFFSQVGRVDALVGKLVV